MNQVKYELFAVKYTQRGEICVSAAAVGPGAGPGRFRLECNQLLAMSAPSEPDCVRILKMFGMKRRVL